MDKPNIVLLSPSGGGKSYDTELIADYYRFQILDIDKEVNGITNTLFENSGCKTKEAFKKQYNLEHQAEGVSDPYTEMKLSKIENLIREVDINEYMIDMPGDKTTGVHPRVLAALKTKGLNLVYKDVSIQVIKERVKFFLKTASEKDVMEEKCSLLTPFTKGDIDGCLFILEDQIKAYRALIQERRDQIDLYIESDIANNLSGMKLLGYIEATLQR